MPTVRLVAGGIVRREVEHRAFNFSDIWQIEMLIFARISASVAIPRDRRGLWLSGLPRDFLFLTLCGD